MMGRNAYCKIRAPLGIKVREFQSYGGEGSRGAHSLERYTTTSKVCTNTPFYTKTCNFLRELNFFSRLQNFLKIIIV